MQDKDLSNLFRDIYDKSDVIIPPRSIVDGTAPAGVFFAFINSPDLMKVRMIDYIRIMAILNRALKVIPPQVIQQQEDPSTTDYFGTPLAEREKQAPTAEGDSCSGGGQVL